MDKIGAAAWRGTAADSETPPENLQVSVSRGPFAANPLAPAPAPLNGIEDSSTTLHGFRIPAHADARAGKAAITVTEFANFPALSLCMSDSSG